MFQPGSDRGSSWLGKVCLGTSPSCQPIRQLGKATEQNRQELILQLPHTFLSRCDVLHRLFAPTSTILTITSKWAGLALLQSLLNLMQVCKLYTFRHSLFITVRYTNTLAVIVVSQPPTPTNLASSNKPAEKVKVYSSRSMHI